jgi:hypothetical protein
MSINEASTRGNTEVIDVVMEELNVDMSKPDFSENLKLVTGDQLSIMCLQAILAAHARNEAGIFSSVGCVFIPGLLHCKIAATNDVYSDILWPPQP